MANPNIVQIASLIGKSNSAIISTSVSTLVANGSGSNQLIKITSLRVTNAVLASAAITVDLYRSGQSYPLVANHVIDSNEPSVLITKDNGIYLEEGDSIRCNSNANVGLAAICSFEVIT